MKRHILYTLFAITSASFLLTGCEDSKEAYSGSYESEEGHLLRLDYDKGTYTLMAPNGRIGSGSYVENDKCYFLYFGETEYSIEAKDEGFLLAAEEEYNLGENLSDLSFTPCEETIDTEDMNSLLGTWINASGAIFHISPGETEESLTLEYSYPAVDGITTVNGITEIYDAFEGKGPQFDLTDSIYFIHYEDGSFGLDLNNYSYYDFDLMKDEEGQEYVDELTNGMNTLINAFYPVDESYEGQE